jgi:hypothetical protein
VGRSVVGRPSRLCDSEEGRWIGGLYFPLKITLSLISLLPLCLIIIIGENNNMRNTEHFVNNANAVSSHLHFHPRIHPFIFTLLKNAINLTSLQSPSPPRALSSLQRSSPRSRRLHRPQHLRHDVPPCSNHWTGRFSLRRRGVSPHRQHYGTVSL